MSSSRDTPLWVYLEYEDGILCYTDAQGFVSMRLATRLIVLAAASLAAIAGTVGVVASAQTVERAPYAPEPDDPGDTGERGAPGYESEPNQLVLPRAPDIQTLPSDAEPQPPTVEVVEPTPIIIPYFDGWLASDDVVRKVAGRVSFEMETCSLAEKWTSDNKRLVRATTSKSLPSGITSEPSVANAILAQAASYAWEQCPQYFLFLNRQTDQLRYNIESVAIYDRDGSLLLTAHLGGEPLTAYGDQSFAGSKKGYQWLDVQDVVAERIATDARVASDAALAADRESQRSDAMRATAERDAAFARDASSTIKWLVAIGLAAWLLTQWQNIAVWIYGLVPHPATRMVDDAIHSGHPIDGELYDAVHRPRFSNSVENGVRERQANELVSRLRRHEASMAAETAAGVLAVKERVERENAFMRAHAELLRAGIDHEVAAARLDEMRRVARS